MSYGVNSKKIMFYDTDKRHAELKIRLQHDNLKQSKKDELFLEFVDQYKKENKTQSKERIEKSKKSIEKGREVEKKFNLKEGEKENIFDLIAREHPDL